MQFRFIPQLLFALSLGLTLTACVEEPTMGKEHQEAALLVDNNVTNIALDATAQERTLQVTNNGAKWEAHCAANWVQYTHTEGDKLQIRVSQNTTDAERKATLTIISANTQQQITISQSAATGSMGSLPTEWKVSQWQQELLVDVNASGNWTATADAEWVKATPNKAARQLRIEVAANPGTTPRVCQLMVSSADGQTTRQLRIEQQAGDTYILPYTVWNDPQTNIHKHEMARHSTLALLPDGVNSDNIYAYSLQSTIFDRVEYMVHAQEYKESILYFRSYDEIAGDKLTALETYLSEQGFSKQGTGLYWNKTLNMEAALEQPSTSDAGATNRGRLLFSIRPPQTKQYPTLKSLVPAGSPFAYNMHTSQWPLLQSWEIKHGSTIDKAKSDGNYHFLWVKDEEQNSAEHRAYDFSPRGEQGQFIQSFGNINLAVWTYHGDYFLTEEFLDLMKREGFVLNNRGSSRQYNFSNEEKGYNAVVLLINSLRTGKLALFINLTQTKASN